MKRLLIAGLLIWCATAQANDAVYASSRAWVVERCRTNQIPTQEQIFVATTPGSAPAAFVGILRYRDGLSIRDLIDQTRFRGTNAVVIVLRSERPATPVFDGLVAATERPKFALKPLDMVWVGQPGLPR